MKSLEVRHFSKTFRTGARTVEAVRDVSVSLEKGKVLGIAGESGSGKSTLARLITRLETPDRGELILNGKDYSHPDRKALRELRQQVQMVFQNAAGSFDPRRPIGETILDSVMNFRMASAKAEGKTLVEKALEKVGLPREIAGALPRQVSGGQCQRAAIVRAVIVRPSLLIFDEATSALDVLVQKNIMELLQKLKEEEKISMLFISHDLALIGQFADDILIMKDGAAVEYGPTERILTDPREDYTKRLLDSVL